MQDFLEILKYIFPALVVLFTTVLVLRQMQDREISKQRFELSMKNKKVTTPIRLQAYERLVIFLERTKPESLIMRTNDNKMNFVQFQSALLQIIRSEFEHNVSQQLYVSTPAWEATKSAKESIVQYINTMAENFPNHDNNIQFKKALIEEFGKLENNPVQIAIDFLKKEAAGIL